MTTRLTTRIGALSLANPVICASGEPVMTEAGIRAALRAGVAGVIAKSVNEQPAAARQLDLRRLCSVGCGKRTRRARQFDFLSIWSGTNRSRGVVRGTRADRSRCRTGWALRRRQYRACRRRWCRGDCASRTSCRIAGVRAECRRAACFRSDAWRDRAGDRSGAARRTGIAGARGDRGHSALGEADGVVGEFACTGAGGIARGRRMRCA